MRRCLAALVAALGLAVPAAASAAPVNMTEFTITPSCQHAGGNIDVTVGVQNTTFWWVDIYFQAKTYDVLGREVASTDPAGPFSVPPFIPIRRTEREVVPPGTLPGIYTVVGGIGGSAQDAMGWSRRSAQLTVSPLC
jgi:hypothetical protein